MAPNSPCELGFKNPLETRAVSFPQFIDTTRLPARKGSPSKFLRGPTLSKANQFTVLFFQFALDVGFCSESKLIKTALFF